ncbi:MAG: hypothetical protein WAM60_14830 [Candidatus Promineifilaceae bacterium]
MSDGIEKLRQDLEILAEMAAEMDSYLKSDVLFWPMTNGAMPRLTLGGYLMRQHRLVALKGLLSDDEKAQLDTAVAQFNAALVEKVVRLEQRANQEIEARLRQWGEYLNDLSRGSGASSYYATAVQPRIMVAALVNKLSLPPYRLEGRAPEQIAMYDGNLRRRWQSGDFVWPEAWQPAYPERSYWYLYGHPK